MATITMIDETGFGNKTHEKKFVFEANELSVRELISQRVFEEVEDYNAKQPSAFQGLVQPSETEQTLNGFKLKKPRLLNWETQFRKATELFSERGFIILVDDAQVDDLDSMLDLSAVNEVTFLKLVPLIGG